MAVAAATPEGRDATSPAPPMARAASTAALRRASPSGPDGKLMGATVSPLPAAPVGAGAFGDWLLVIRYRLPEAAIRTGDPASPGRPAADDEVEEEDPRGHGVVSTCTTSVQNEKSA